MKKKKVWSPVSLASCSARWGAQSARALVPSHLRSLQKAKQMWRFKFGLSNTVRSINLFSLYTAWPQVFCYSNRKWAKSSIKKRWVWTVEMLSQHCEFIWCHWTAHIQIVKMINIGSLTFYHSNKTKSPLLTRDHEDLDVNSRFVLFGLSSYTDRRSLGTD